MRTSLLQLLKWVDGAPYVMRDRWVPLDFFACDAVLLQLPPSSLWHYASHTYGWEHVSTILRTRHIVSISLTFQAYNRAAIAIKQRHCVDGFNQNQRLLLTEGVAAAAVPSTLPVFGDPPIKKNEDEDGLEFVFVSSCSNADQWQADMLVESFERVHQRGSITRIITGCSTPALLNQVILGDHGMSSDGNHGGATDDETGAALFLYSKALPLHVLDGTRSLYDVLFYPDPDTSAVRSVAQVDLVPTLSLLMGLPIPFGNLGAVIPQLFFEPSSNQTSPSASISSNQTSFSAALAHLNDALWVNVHQLRHQFTTSQTIRMDLPAMLDLEATFAEAALQDGDAKGTHDLLQKYLADALALSRALYTQFDLVCMVHGVVLQLSTFLALHLTSFRPHRVPISILVGILVGFMWPAAARVLPPLLPGAPMPRYAATIGLSTVGLAFEWQPPSLSPKLSPKLSPIVSWRRSVGVTMLVVMHCLSLFSNSYLVVQDRVVLFISASNLVLVGMDLLAPPACSGPVTRGTGQVTRFVGLCVLHRVYAAWPVPNIVLSSMSMEWTYIPMLVVGVWIARVDPASLVSYVCVWMHWWDIWPLFVPWVVYAWGGLNILTTHPPSVLLVLLLLHGPTSPGPFGLFVAMSFLYQSGPSTTSSSSTSMWGYCFLIHSLYFQSGHGNSFASLQNAAGFVGVPSFYWPVAGTLLAVNTFGAFWLGLSLLLTTIRRPIVVAYFTLSAICTSVFVALSRRHLMVWAIFAPKFVFDALVSLVVHLLVLVQSCCNRVIL
ncbi:hypothetical protein B5M09_010006 [Aphanomyces astaci]|uniref:GPI ethanolamine phosphate transferase 1 n=1 Tax=Aphanomyces astaci TaxID=112090 RepID=A0A3R7WET9_APHAT|nr:hypothetical protein B5M09_010006 [Aphanomyces astaci]